MKFLSISLMTESDIVWGRGRGGRPTLIYYCQIFYVSESMEREDVIVAPILVALFSISDEFPAGGFWYFWTDIMVLGAHYLVKSMLGDSNGTNF